MTMTHDELKTAKAYAEEVLTRANKATEGPWAWESTGENSWCLGGVYPPQTGEILEVFNEETEEYAEKPEVVDFVAQGGDSSNLADPNFISYARTDVPTLATMVLHLIQTVEALSGEKHS